MSDVSNIQSVPILPVTERIQFVDPQSKFDFDYEEQFFLGTTSNKGFSLINTGGMKTVDLSNLFGTLEKIMIINHDQFSPPSVTTVRFLINGAPSANYYITLPVIKFFLWTIDPVFATKILSMDIATNSITSINVDVIAVTSVPPPPVV